ncbi:zinc-binding alcohol dehydrogenase family protein [Gordonia jinhuaensis]|uniref:Zinc-type alcohol dehydrogenase-like protein n=2 Tax=Gordonia jinhuaensis TaxID=1517702 RepID=A0A916TAR8_9ACTN|nr:NADPH:quinone reductase [Gordonia jinhuaensis]
MITVKFMAHTASAIASLAPGPVDADRSFAEVEISVGDPGPHDLLVEVHAVSVNPVDVKTRASFDGFEAPKVLGYDAAGVVVAVGSEVSRFAVGDAVYYAGAINRPGSNARLQLVDERIVGHKPSSLSFCSAAALPLTTLTAWECLFDRLHLDKAGNGTLVVVGGAGGVGSMVIQLARRLTAMTVIATASRDVSESWVRSMGADEVVDHRQLRDAVPPLAPDGVSAVFSSHSAGNVESYARILGVHGQVVAIDDPEGLDTMPLKQKSQSWLWEFMFTKPLYLPEDDSQHRILDEVARMVDAGHLQSTATTVYDEFTVDTLRDAHRRSESGSTIGKIVLMRADEND